MICSMFWDSALKSLSGNRIQYGILKQIRTKIGIASEYFAKGTVPAYMVRLLGIMMSSK